MIYKLLDTYDYVLPDIPEKEDILFHDISKEKQYWQHPNFNFEEINNKWTDEKKIKFVERELSRRKNGCWFMNNGEPTYITGSHYFFLVYFKVPVDNIGMSYPAFRNYQKEVFYFLDFVDKDKYCEGAAISKPRRVGATAIINADVMNLSMLRSDRIFSIQNKKLEEAQRFNYAPIKFNVEHFPSIKLSNGKEIFSPRISAGNIQNRRMRWGVSMKDKEELGEDELNTQIYIVPSVQNADDGGQAHRLIRDEVSKYKSDINISTMLSILRPVAQTGTTQVGKIIFFCTSDVEDSPNFEEWKKIYKGSDYTLREKRKTKSGLYKYIISAKYSLAGEVIDNDGNEVMLFDDYGNCKEELAIQWITDKKRDALNNGDLKALQEIRRNFPIDEEDAFESESGTSCYDTVRLAAQTYEIEKREKKVEQGIELPFYTMGRLEWVVKDREVEFKADPFGHWKIFELPEKSYANKNFIDDYGFLCPKTDSPYLWTCDPFAFREMVKGGSKGGIVIGSCIDANLLNMGGTINARYNHRTPNPNEFLEELRKGIIFYSARGLPENNKEWVAMALKDGTDSDQNNRFKYGKFMFVYENGKFRIWRNGDKIAGISNQQKSIEAYVRATSDYLKEPKNGEFDYLKAIWDKELLEQWKKFTPLDTEKFDLGVTASMFCMLVKSFTKIIQPDTDVYSDQSLIRAWLGIQNKQQQDKRKYSLIAE